MARFNTRFAEPKASSPVTTTGERTLTSLGGDGYLREPKSELFLLAVSNMVGTDAFHEKAGDRDGRFAGLVRALAVEDPRWCGDFLRWLRGPAALRTAALVGAAEFAAARLALGAPGHSRQVVDAVLQRADEPGEMLGYWTGRYGRAVPKPVKRGIADAVRRLYDERALLKYDTDSRGYRFGDVLGLVHASPAAAKPWQGPLFRHAVGRRRGRDEAVPGQLAVLAARAELAAVPVGARRAVLTGPGGAERLRAAGMTWEALAGWLQGPLDAAAWEAVIPSMGYMALLRNLRNFDEAGVSDEVAERVAARLADPERVARSRQLPLRFYSAYNAAPSLRWGHALDKALSASLANVPELRGRTLVLVDTSSSMDDGFSRDGTLKRWDAAALFGIALGRRCQDADIVSFSSGRRAWGDAPSAHTRAFRLRRAESPLAAVRRWKDGGWFLGGGTDTACALREEYRRHDRVVVITDEQAGHDAREVTHSIPESVPMYTWNLAGYAAAHAPSGGRDRHTFGGLTDAAFRMVGLIEAGRDARWPWQR